MFYAVLSLIILNAIVLGYGAAYKKIIFLNSNEKVQNIDCIYGFFLLITLSIFLNFFFPLKFFSHTVAIVGLLFFLYFLYKKKFEINFLSLITISIFFVFISKNNSLLYDSRLYHLQTIQFTSNFPIILGIANLEPRYGMNSSWHSFLSLINLEILSLKFIYLGNLTLTCFFFNEIFKKNFLLDKKISHIFLFITIFYICIYSFLHPSANGTIFASLSSPEVDYVAMIFYLLSFYFFLEYYEKKSDQILNLLSTSIFLTVTIKIGYIGITLFFLYLLINNRRIAFFNKINLLILFSSIIWLIRGLLLSGCFLFPVSFTCVKFNWSMSIFDVNTYSKIIQSFARDTPERLKFSDFNHTLNSFDWVAPWFSQYFLKTEFLYISIIFIFINIIVLFFIFFYKREIFPISKNFYLISLIIFFINLYIWFKAPEIRFGYGTIISFVAFTMSLIVLIFFKNYLNSFFLNLLIILMFIPLLIKNEKNMNNMSENFFQRSFNYSSIKKIYITNGFKVYKPTQDVYCDYFEGFCSYQGLKVRIEKKRDYLFMFND